VSSQQLAAGSRIRGLKIAIVILSIAAFVSGCYESKRKQVKLADDRSYAASIFRQNCAICHGQEAEGKEVSGKAVPSLRTGKAATLTDEQIYTQISNGGNGMLPFKQQLSEKDIREMVKFVKNSLQGRE
jgi:mono/diheme cytochrome c family protein